MRAHILSIGSELILGHLTDTNATFLAQSLAELGIELTLVTQVGDDLDRLSTSIARASDDAEIVICTGGVGPTADDLTREAIARVMGEAPEIQPELLETIRAFFRARGIEMPERNSKQAWLIPSAETLPNPVGTAPGWFVRRNDRVIAAMPGVPREMFKMWREQVVPRVLALGGQRSIRSVTYRTIGIGESAAEQLLHDLVALENPVVATYAKDDGVHVRVTATAESDGEAEARRDTTAAEVKRRLAQYIYGVDDTTLPQALAGLLNDRGGKLAVIDQGGGGRFAGLIAGDPGSASLLIRSEMSPHATGANAGELAERAVAGESGRAGVGIVVKASRSTEGVFEGTIAVAVRGIASAEDHIPVRAGFEDIQRRSGLFAADILRRALTSAV
jgi:nicotinamide-nucleotide amidase